MLIYKYMPFRESYFNNFMLKISRYGEFNDPFDLVLGEYGMSLPASEAEEFYDMMPEYYKTLDYYSETYLEIEAGARASLAILCFSEIFESILMWSHYADNHTGLCIGYDAECNFFNSMYGCNYSMNVGELKPVVYTEERPQFILPSDLVNNTNDWFKKSIDWSYEKEHRILLPMDNATEIALKPETIWGYKIDPVNIKKIIMGCRMKSEQKQYIHKKVAGYDIELIEVKPHPSCYKLKFQSYDANSDVDIVYNLGVDV